MGLIWRVGNGSSIKINEFPWVPNQPNFKMDMKEDKIQNIKRVEQLMLNNPRRWNSELIETLFDLPETTLIQQIPLAQGNVQDVVA